MLDVRRIRNDPDEVRKALARRHDGSDAEVDRVLDLDRRRREAVADRDALRGEVKAISHEVGRLRREGATEDAERRAADSSRVGARVAERDREVAALDRELHDLLLRIPNTPAADAPDGEDEADNVVLRTVGYDPDAYAEHQRVPHWDIAARLGLLDPERAVKIAGSMFVMYRGLGATLNRALCQLALDRNADAFEEVRPPHLVSSATLTASGQLPKFADDAYHVERDDLWAIPTAEVPLTSLARDEILREDELPVRLMAATPCYRREAGSAGKDTRGLLRSHEFDKVEILALGTPEQGPGLLDELLARAESTIAALGLAYRLVDICTGDLGQTHHRSIDVEVYAPGCGQWLEVSSVSWFSDYQARRANIRYRPAAGGGPVVAHTLNGSALAVPRVWAALVETNHRPDGSVALPEVLHPYLRGATSIPAR